MNCVGVSGLSHPRIDMSVKDEQGNIVTDKEAVLDRLAADFSVLYSPTLNVEFVFSVCFTKGITPKHWGKGIINPIPKSNWTAMDPLTSRGITISCSMYKLFCSVFLNLLPVWCRVNQLLL